jgi:hypothetical protein
MRPRNALFSFLLCVPTLGATGAPPTPDEVARSILYNANARPLREVFNAALTKKFPVGSSLDELADFFHKLGGYCARNTNGVTFRCEADIEPCQNTLIAWLDAKDDVITSIRTVELALKTCD